MANLTGKGLTGSEIRKIRRELNRTRWALRAEIGVRAFWPAFTVICLIAAVAILGGFEAFGPLMHRILLGVAGLALVATLVLAGMRLRRPGRCPPLPGTNVRVVRCSSVRSMCSKN